ncbi:hypothetical protein [Roseinatronobacter sp. NSM]|uniref:hypothetical protein n=1 Tax=Roseinatronobacter sp. NSM TaxID=3457785 RepID=UPI004035F9EF
MSVFLASGQGGTGKERAAHVSCVKRSVPVAELKAGQVVFWYILQTQRPDGMFRPALVAVWGRRWAR